MTTTVEAVIVNQALFMFPQFMGDLLMGMTSGWTPKILYFKIGEGGWRDPGTSIYTRRKPDESLTDLDCIINPTRYPTTSRWSFTKTLAPGDCTWEAPGTLKVRCFLDFSEANTDASLANPDFWEIGVYAEDPYTPGQKFLIGYGTIQKQTKTSALQLTNVVRLTFSR